MQPIDYAILGLYLIGTTAVGAYCQRSQKNTGDFLLAGRSMAWVPVGISIVAAFISGISYIGLPAEIRSNGLPFVVYLLSYLIIIPLVLRLFLPFYSRQQITTAYEYLETRFSLTVRRLASSMFIVWRLLWTATVIYVPSLVLSELLGLALIPTILVTGVVTTLYTAMGGIKAVIWTDFAQFFVMLGGALLAIVFIAREVPGGLLGIWHLAEDAGHTRVFNLSLDPTVRITLWGALIGGSFANLTYFGVDQLIIQRYLATRSPEDLRRTFLLNCFALTFLVVLLALLGLALFAFYESRSAQLPPSVKADTILVYFIAREFPAGLTGLLVASIFAATMSSISAGVNAISTALYADFFKREHRLKDTQSSGELRYARQLTLLVGGVSTLFACFVGHLGTVMEIAVRLIDGFTGPLLGIFLVGMFTRTVGAMPVIVSGILGVLLTAYMNFFTSISFMWYPVVGCLSTILAALLLHKVFGARPRLLQVSQA